MTYSNICAHHIFAHIINIYLYIHTWCIVSCIMSFYMCMQCTKLAVSHMKYWDSQGTKLMLGACWAPKPEVGSICFCFFVLTCAYYLLTSKAVGWEGMSFGQPIFWEVLGSICIIAHPHAAHPNPYRHPHFPLRPPYPHRSIIFMLILILIVIVIVRVLITIIVFIGLLLIMNYEHHRHHHDQQLARIFVSFTVSFIWSGSCVVALLASLQLASEQLGMSTIEIRCGSLVLMAYFVHSCICLSVYPRLTYLLQLFMVQVTAKASVLFTTSCAFGMLILGPSVRCQEMLFELKGRK